VLAGLDVAHWWQDKRLVDALHEPMVRAAAWYFLHARSRTGAPVDQVARFHLGNGARLERINWLADVSEKAVGQSHGLMVNYLYDLADIEKNHEAYAENRTVVASGAVTRLARTGARDLVPAGG
jgi:malonyl-CoA decarboxylase